MSSSQVPFRQYVLGFKKEANQEQTHTWFSPTQGTTILHVPENRKDEFLEQVYEYITITKESILENPKRGENSITEKVISTANKFRMFADIDFKVELFEKHDLPSDPVALTTYMSDLVKIYDSIIEEIYGTDYLCDRVLATRLPYKLHIIYPSIVVNKKIANYVATRFIEKLKLDPRFTAILEADEKIVDKSVYNTGLRMVGMHKSNMGKKHKMEQELRTHENIFGENSYSHCYKFADPDTLEPIPWSLTLFNNASIHVETSRTFTLPLNQDEFNTFIKGKEKATNRNSFRTGTGSSTEIVERSVFEDDSSTRTLIEEGINLVQRLHYTCKFLTDKYNHILNPGKIKVTEKEDEDTGTVSRFVIFPLETHECHFAKRPHSGNHQYLIVSNTGSKQKCHDCPGQEHKVIRPTKFPNSVKRELIDLRILTPDLPIKTRKKEPEKEASKDEKVNALTNYLPSLKEPHFKKNELKVDINRTTVNEFGVCIGLQDLWCEICKKTHSEPRTYIHASDNGKLCLKCTENPALGLFYPDPPVKLDIGVRQILFSNCTFSINQTIVNNYLENTGDVSVDFEEVSIFEDDTLNHFMYESLVGTSWSVVKVIHHLGKYHFNCTKSGEWYAYKKHRWVTDSESSFNCFISEKVAPYYREVRDYYRENTENVELRAKRVNHLQKLVEKLTNNNSKTELLKEARGYFYEYDFYEANDAHFEKLIDQNRSLLCFTNGVYNLDTDEFRDGSPYDFITLSTGNQYCETSDPEKRTIIEKFFIDMQPDVEEREYLLLFLSSLLHGMTKEETFHIFTGAAANGKSLLRDLIMYTLGEYFESIPANLITKERPSSSSPQPEIVKLKGKRAVFGSEPEANQKINTGFMKWITGNDPLKARLCHSNDLITFQPHFKLVLLCNDIPVMDSNDIGTWRRSRIKEFPVTFTDNPRPGNIYEKPIDETLKSRMYECRNEFMLYLMEYFKRFRSLRRLKPTDKVLQMVEQHKKKSNTVAQFIEDHTEEAKGKSILISELYPKYMKWMKDEMPGEQPLIKTKLIEEIQRMRTIDYGKYCRIKGRTGGGQPGIKHRQFINRELEEIKFQQDVEDFDTGMNEES